MSELTVIARAVAQEGKGDELERELQACVAPTRGEAGNLQFELHRSLENPEEVIAIERWASKEDHERHFETEHVRTLIERTQPIMAAPPEMQVYAPVR
jgi:quinol monooxygenase YgiN